MNSHCILFIRIKDAHIKPGELLLINCKASCLQFKQTPITHHDKVILYDKPIKVNPMKLRINHHMIAYITNAKAVLNPSKDKISVISL
jgi:hypothetical protein